jgi:hypothetical protein
MAKHKIHFTDETDTTIASTETRQIIRVARTQQSTATASQNRNN